MPNYMNEKRDLMAKTGHIALALATSAFLSGCVDQQSYGLSESDIMAPSNIPLEISPNGDITGDPVSRNVRIVAKGSARRVSNSAALVQAKSAKEPIIGVVQTDYSNAVSQSISYLSRGLTPGENAIDVSVFRTGGSMFQKSGVRLKRSKDVSLAAEAARLFPGVASVSAPRAGQNGFGPFGYVTLDGQGSDRCILAMQNGVGIKQRVDIRMRYCVPGASDSELVRLAQSITQ